MGKVKGGLGDASLISDLTKPISFHISETLEPPPVYERQKRVTGKLLQKGKDQFAGLILEKVVSALEDSGNVQILFHFEGRSEQVLAENLGEEGGPGHRLSAVRGENGDFYEVPWQDSVFSDMDMKDILNDFSAHIKGIEVTSDETFLNFSSLDDFYEWLEL